VTGSGKRLVQISEVADGGASVMVPARSAFLDALDRAQFAERDAAALVIARDLFHRAVQIDRRVVAGFAKQRDHALRLAERIGADQMRPLRKQRDRGQELPDLVAGGTVTKHRQPEGGLGDEDIAGHHFERRAGGVRRVLVVAGGDDAGVLAGHRDLRRAQHMAGGVKFEGDITEFYRFAIGDGLGAAGKMVAVAQPHHVERFLRGQHRAMAGPGVVGMAVGDHGALDRPHRIDMKAAGLAAQTGGDGHQDVLRAHPGYIVQPKAHSSLVLRLSLTLPNPHRNRFRPCPRDCSCPPAI
jgi:hypothetical protein